MRNPGTLCTPLYNPGQRGGASWTGWLTACEEWLAQQNASSMHRSQNASKLAAALDVILAPEMTVGVSAAGAPSYYRHTVEECAVVAVGAWNNSLPDGPHLHLIPDGARTADIRIEILPEWSLFGAVGLAVPTQRLGRGRNGPFWRLLIDAGYGGRHSGLACDPYYLAEVVMHELGHVLLLDDADSCPPMQCEAPLGLPRLGPFLEAAEIISDRRERARRLRRQCGGVHAMPQPAAFVHSTRQKASGDDIGCEMSIERLNALWLSDQLPVQISEYWRGRILLALGSYQEALERFDRVLALNGEFCELQVLRGLVYSTTNSLKARRCFERALVLRPWSVNAAAYFARARCAGENLDSSYVGPYAEYLERLCIIRLQALWTRIAGRRGASMYWVTQDLRHWLGAWVAAMSIRHNVAPWSSEHSTLA